jgi:hypothetical protein
MAMQALPASESSSLRQEPVFGNDFTAPIRIGPSDPHVPTFNCSRTNIYKGRIYTVFDSEPTIPELKIILGKIVYELGEPSEIDTTFVELFERQLREHLLLNGDDALSTEAAARQLAREDLLSLPGDVTPLNKKKAIARAFEAAMYQTLFREASAWKPDDPLYAKQLRRHRLKGLQYKWSSYIEFCIQNGEVCGDFVSLTYAYVDLFSAFETDRVKVLDDNSRGDEVGRILEALRRSSCLNEQELAKIDNRIQSIGK